MNKSQTKFLWQHLSIIKEFQKETSHTNNTKLLDIDVIVMIFIGSHNRIAITRILKHKYFSQYGESTIKRSVHRLIKLNLVEQSHWKLDDRKKLLNVNFELINKEVVCKT